MARRCFNPDQSVVVLGPKSHNRELLGFLPGSEDRYLKTLRDEYQSREQGLLLQLQAASDVLEREAVNKAVQELRKDYKTKIANAKWNLYLG
jgi:hypothetical protein